MGPWLNRLTRREALPPGRGLLALSIDTMVDGVHFDRHTSPEELGYKALAVNLSDMAAMGATPRSAGLALFAPKPLLNEAADGWLERFAGAMLALANEHDLRWRGGEIREGPLNVTVEIDGTIDGAGLRRDAAQPGDSIYVSGTLGDAGAGLRLIQTPHIERPINAEDRSMLIERLKRPIPRVALGRAAAGLAHAAIDVSDGLAADLRHILERSGLAAQVDTDLLPLSGALRRAVDPSLARELAVSAGDDYELALTVSKSNSRELEQQARTLGCRLTAIGHVLSPTEHLPTGTIAWTAANAEGWQPKLGYGHFS